MGGVMGTFWKGVLPEEAQIQEDEMIITAL